MQQALLFLLLGLLLSHKRILILAAQLQQDGQSSQLSQRVLATDFMVELGTSSGIPQPNQQPTLNYLKVSVKTLLQDFKSGHKFKELLNPDCSYQTFKQYRTALCKVPLAEIPEFFFKKLPIYTFLNHDITTQEDGSDKIVMPRLSAKLIEMQGQDGTFPTAVIRRIVSYVYNHNNSIALSGSLFFYTALPLAISIRTREQSSHAHFEMIMNFGLNLPISLLLEKEYFFVWILAVQLEAFYYSLLDKSSQSPIVGMQNLLNSIIRKVEKKVEFIKDTHQDHYTLCKRLLQVNFLPSFTPSSSSSRAYSETAQQYFAEQGETDWLKGMGEMLGLWPFSEHPYDRCSTFSRVAYRLLAYASTFNPVDNAETQNIRNNLFTMVAMGVDVHEMTNDEVSLAILVSSYTKVFEFPEAILLIRPDASFAGAFKPLLKNLPFEQLALLKAATLFSILNIMPKKESYMLTESYFRERAMGSLEKCATLQLTGDSGGSSTNTYNVTNVGDKRKRCQQIEAQAVKTPKITRFRYVEEHFIPRNILAIPFTLPLTIMHLPRHALNGVTIDATADQSLEIKEFILPSLNETILAERIKHFNSHQSEGPTGDAKWRKISPDHAAFDNTVLVFVEKMFSLIGWLIRKPKNRAYVYFEGSYAYGDGLDREAFSIFAEVIMLPFVGLFRYDDKLEGFLPLPTLSPMYMALLAEFHALMLKANLPFKLPLAPMYLKFLCYSEPFDQPIRSIIRELYAHEFESLEKTASMAHLTEYYPQILRTHVPIALDYPFEHTPADPFSFANPFEELDAWGTNNLKSCRAWQEFDSVDDQASKADFVAVYAEMLYSTIMEHALRGRFEYQRIFLSKIHQSMWPAITFSFFEQLMRGPQRVLTADEVYHALCFGDEMACTDGKVSDKMVYVIDDETAKMSSEDSLILKPKEALKRVLCGFSPEMLLKFLWFCTGMRRVPPHTLPPSLIKVEMTALFLPQMPAGGNASTPREQRQAPGAPNLTEPAAHQVERLKKACLLPSAHTCLRVVKWTIQPYLSEVRRAFEIALENVSGFEVSELDRDQIAALEKLSGTGNGKVS